jgi:microcystin-dependent protein
VTAPFVGEVRVFGFNFPPRGYLLASGQLIPISQNTALFSILGTTYGGNGTSNFALPNLNGTAGMGNGNGPGLTPRVLGETLGETSVTILNTEMPAHNHLVNAANVAIVTPAQLNNTPNNTALLSFSGPGNAWGETASPPVNMSPLAIGPAGGSQPHSNVQPYLTLNFCVAVQGVFPPRN